MNAADELKQSAKLAKDLIEHVQDRMGQDEHTDYEDQIRCLDIVVGWLEEAASRHGDPAKFEDGTPVSVNIRLAKGYVGTYFPRHDGDFDAWLERMKMSIRPNLTVVES